MVVYDVTSDQSFDSCAKWLERVKAQKPTPELPLPSEHSNEMSLRTKFLFKKMSLPTKFLFKKNMY